GVVSCTGTLFRTPDSEAGRSAESIDRLSWRLPAGRVPYDALRSDADLVEVCPECVRFWQILLKKSVDEVTPIFPASLVRFLERDARDLIAQRRSDVDRCKWNCEAIYNRFQISMRFELVCALL